MKIFQGMRGWKVAALGSLAATACAVTATGFLDGETWGAYFGGNVAQAADVDRDGVPDFLVGAPLANTGSTGKVYLYSGNTRQLLRSWDGEAASDQLSQAANAGDVDWDWVPDILTASTMHGGVGRANLVSGRTGAVLRTMDGEQKLENCGYALAGGTDLNRDYVPDQVVSSPWYSGAGGQNCGRVRVFSGRTGKVLYAWEGEAAGDRFGVSVAAPGDLNSDGYPDVLVGAGWRNGAGYQLGKVYAYSGKDGRLLWSREGDETYGTFGMSLAVADVNGDRVKDVIVSQDGHRSPAGYNVGRVWLLKGQDGTTLYSLDGEAAGDRFGKAVGRAFDADLDGAEDILVGATGHDGAAGLDSGKAYLYSGRTGALLRSWEGESAYASFGRAVTCTRNAFVISAPYQRRSDGVMAGRVYLFDNLQTVAP